MIRSLQATTMNQMFDNVIRDLDDMLDAVVTAMDKDTLPAPAPK
jgi:hypothetical protein